VSAPAERCQPVYVWDVVVRTTHWLIVGSVLVLAATGFYLGRPFVIAHGGFVTGWVKVVHFYTATVFTAAVLARLGWLFVSSSPYARWNQLVPTSRQRWHDLWGTFQFYTFLRRDPPAAVGHNPLAGVAYIAVFGLYVTLIATGLGLYSVDASIGSPSRLLAWVVPLVGGAQSTRWLHHVSMWLLLGFMVHHVFSAVLVARVEKNGCLDSIFSGWKFIGGRHG
jgi:Ni/Fe-hydrogenase 1 B-type cytochrome subunit